MTEPLPTISSPPSYCHYAAGPCDQSFDELAHDRAIFLYASKPEPIAGAIEQGVRELRRSVPDETWRTWRDLPIQGQVIFCEICKAQRFASMVIADVTTLNFNLLFEIGYCIGLGVPLVLIRDTSYMLDQREFDALGLLDTLGYADFENGADLALKITQVTPRPLPPRSAAAFRESPLYVLKGPIDTEGAVLMMSTLKKSRIRFRTYDPDESPRLPLGIARKQVSGSFGVVAHLLSPQRSGSRTHNGMCALLCGIALAEGKVVAMLQEESVQQPIDYRDIVQHYQDPRDVAMLLAEPIRQVVDRMQEITLATVKRQPRLLERVDLGDVAAENEIRGLREYFVRTGQFREALQPHGHLVVGRKGSGKTAMFYEIRDAIGSGHRTLVLDLKPDGHQFTKLREAVLQQLPQGQQEHLVVAFWNYILLAEMARKILERELRLSLRDPGRLARYQELDAAYEPHALASGDDLSHRLLRQVDRLAERLGSGEGIPDRDDLTALVYGGDITALTNAVAKYLEEKDAVWFLVDNLDKSWATRGTTTEEVLILRGLLEASAKVERQLSDRDVEFGCRVFLRTDVYEHLVRNTPDRDKETPISLDIDDPEVLKAIIARRIESSTELHGDFESMWRVLFESHVGLEDSFHYILDRTMMRPRDVIRFAQRAIEVALNREHDQVRADDVRQAEVGYSEDMLLSLMYEMEDTQPILADVVYAFQGSPGALTATDVAARLEEFGLVPDAVPAAVELLSWFGFLGIVDPSTGEERYAYNVRFNLRQLSHAVDRRGARYVVHPAFRVALGVAGP